MRRQQDLDARYLALFGELPPAPPRLWGRKAYLDELEFQVCLMEGRNIMRRFYNKEVSDE